jgi:hypothetical protein
VWGRPSLCEIGAFKVNGRCTLSLVSKCQGLQQEVLAHCFPVRIELVRERNACKTKVFTIGTIPCSNEMDKHLYLMAKYNAWEAGLSCTLSPYEKWVTCWKNTAYHWLFSCVRNITVEPKSCLHLNGARSVYHVRTPLVVATRGSRSLFSSENWVKF